MKKNKLQTFALCSLFSVSLASQAALESISESDLLAKTDTIVSYDFETPQFVYNDYIISSVDNISFDATTFTSTPYSYLPESQYLTGASGTLSSATINFSAYDSQVLGFGFYGYDLIDDKQINVTVDFKNKSGTETFAVGLNGADAFTAMYFAAYSANDSINSITLNATGGPYNYDCEASNNICANTWLIDNLTLVTTPAAVPVPAALPLFLAGLGLLGFNFGRKRPSRI